MNTTQLFESFGSLDDDILQNSEKKPTAAKWLTAAACLALIAAAVFTLPRVGTDNAANVSSDPSASVDVMQYTANKTSIDDSEWEMYTNSVSSDMMTDSARLYTPGYFTEELSEDELISVIPGQIISWMSYEGISSFNGEGELLDVDLDITTRTPDCSINVNISGSETPACYVYGSSPEVSVCGDVEYTVYEFQHSDAVTLEAYAAFNGACFTFTVTADSGDMDTVRADFKSVLECFACYSSDKPDLDAVTYETIPQWFDNRLTYNKAMQDVDFGEYMLQSVPTGFREESVRRYKDQYSDYLSGLWTQGYCEISWRVSRFSESDESRLTSVSDRENYDLSLYPIPRADSVPEEKREIVDDPIFDISELTAEAVWARAYMIDDAGDTDGYRMSFSVRYGDILVHVSAKGIDPDWLFDRLTELK